MATRCSNGERPLAGCARGHERLAAGACLKGDASLADITQAPRRLALETSSDQVTNRRWCVCRQCGQVRHVAHYRGEDLGPVCAWKRSPTGKHFVQHHAEGPDVRSLVHGLAARLLGRHVGRRTEEGALKRGPDP